MYSLVVFAKEPVAGEVKTRLTPPLTSAEAAILYTAFVEDTCATIAAASEPGDRRVLAAPGGTGSVLARIAKEYGFETAAQEGADLGARMAHALGVELARGAHAAVVVGTDSPAMPAVDVRDALRLAGEKAPRAVLGPARDGGYWLIGASGRMPDLFAGIPWSTPDVLPATLERAKLRGVEVVLARHGYDVDDAADLRFLEAELERNPSLSPRTRAAIAVLRSLDSGFFRGGT